VDDLFRQGRRSAQGEQLVEQLRHPARPRRRDVCEGEALPVRPRVVPGVQERGARHRRDQRVERGTDPDDVVDAALVEVPGYRLGRLPAAGQPVTVGGAYRAGDPQVWRLGEGGQHLGAPADLVVALGRLQDDVTDPPGAALAAGQPYRIALGAEGRTDRGRRSQIIHPWWPFLRWARCPRARTARVPTAGAGVARNVCTRAAPGAGSGRAARTRFLESPADGSAGERVRALPPLVPGSARLIAGERGRTVVASRDQGLHLGVDAE
jgi:hypothetical protein